MENIKLTPQEIEEEIISNTIRKAIFDLDLKRGNGVTLEKSNYIEYTQIDLEQQLSELKKQKGL